MGSMPGTSAPAPAADIPDNRLPPPVPTIRVTRVLDRIFTLMRNRFWLIYGITLVVYVPFFFYNLLMRQLNVAMLEGASPLFMRTEVLVTMGLGMLVFVGAVLIIYPLGTMAATTALARSYLGQPATVFSSYREVLRLFLPAIGMILLVWLLVTVGALMCILPGVYLMLRFYVVYPVLAVERRPVVDCLSRSADLMRGNYFQVFLVAMCVGCVKFALAYAVSLTGQALFGGTGVVSVVLYAASQFLGQLFIAPLDFLAAVVVYFELREAREGLDLELMAGDLARKLAPRALESPDEGP